MYESSIEYRSSFYLKIRSNSGPSFEVLSQKTTFNLYHMMFEQATFSIYLENVQFCDLVLKTKTVQNQKFTSKKGY